MIEIFKGFQAVRRVFLPQRELCKLNVRVPVCRLRRNGLPECRPGTGGVTGSQQVAAVSAKDIRQDAGGAERGRNGPAVHHLSFRKFLLLVQGKAEKAQGFRVIGMKFEFGPQRQFRPREIAPL